MLNMAAWARKNTLRDAARAYKGKRIVVTGAGGFLGGALVAALSEAECEILALTRQSGLTFSKGNARIESLTAQYGSPPFWKKILKDIDFIFHFAAQTSVPLAESHPVENFHANVLPLLTLLQVCRENLFKPAVLFAGTATQTGLPGAWPVDETTPSNPVTVYDLHKQMAEDYLKFFAWENAVRGVSLRLSNVYGPGPAASQPDRGILNQMMARAFRGQPITIYGSGNAVRDYIYTEDVLSAFLTAGLHMPVLNGAHFMIGSGTGHTIREAFTCVRDIAAKLTGITAALEYQEPPSEPAVIEKRNFVAGIQTFCALTGWQPLVRLEEGIERTMRSWA